MKHVNKYLSLALALVLCLSLAACGESNEDYGDDGSDYNLYGVPDSFEGLVKDSEQMANLYIYGGAWTGEDGGTLIVANNDEGDEVRFALYDIDEELTASGFIQFVPEYDYDYFYNEHDGVAYRSWFDEVGALHVAEFGTFTQMTGDAPGENTGDIDFEMMAGIWYLDNDRSAERYIVIDSAGSWSLCQRTPGSAEAAEIDHGTFFFETDGPNIFCADSSVREMSLRVFYFAEDGEDGVIVWGEEDTYYRMER